MASGDAAAKSAAIAGLNGLPDDQKNFLVVRTLAALAASVGKPDPAKRAWRARFTINVEPSGPVHALITLNGDKTFVRMWAERPATVQQLRAGIGELNQALPRAELQPGDIMVREGTPPQPAPARAGHFLDRAT